MKDGIYGRPGVELQTATKHIKGNSWCLIWAFVYNKPNLPKYLLITTTRLLCSRENCHLMLTIKKEEISIKFD